jgi:hypothetical protein
MQSVLTFALPRTERLRTVSMLEQAVDLLLWLHCHLIGFSVYLDGSVSQRPGEICRQVMARFV